MADLFLEDMGVTDTVMDDASDLRAGSAMRQVVAVIPVKRLAEAKSRLSCLLSPDQRRRLVLGCLRREIDLLSRVAGIEEVVVVTPDPEVRRIAEEMKVRVLSEPVAFGHNAALDFAARSLGAHAGGDMMILPADLPLLSLSAIEDLLALRPAGEPAIAIAPDRLCSGTNALVCPLPATLPFCFGPGSFHKHVQAAEERGLRPRVLETAPLALDIDTPEDLAILRLVDPSLSDRLLGRCEGAGPETSPSVG
jgi:2-phospho-L-lactate guanylyltransferase